MTCSVVLNNATSPPIRYGIDIVLIVCLQINPPQFVRPLARPCVQTVWPNSNATTQVSVMRHHSQMIKAGQGHWSMCVFQIHIVESAVFWKILIAIKICRYFASGNFATPRLLCALSNSVRSGWQHIQAILSGLLVRNNEAWHPLPLLYKWRSINESTILLFDASFEI